MGLSVEIGMLAALVQIDPDGVGWLRESFESLNEVLADHGLPPHREPESLPSLDNRASLLSYPYRFLHHLRRIAAHAAENAGWEATPFPESSDPANDPLVEKHSELVKSHLLCHSDCKGYYLPIDFDQIIFDEKDRIPGGMLGSSFMLQRELVAAAPALGIHLENGLLSDQEADRINREIDAQRPLWIEKAVWLSLFESARLSVEHNTAICFT